MFPFIITIILNILLYFILYVASFKVKKNRIQIILATAACLIGKGIATK